MQKRGRKEKTRWVAVSGGFDPIHVGHVRMMREARALGDKLVVILNNDNWLRLKKGFVFMPESERLELISALPFVDKVILTDHTKKDKDMSIARMLRMLKPDVFANGGDRTLTTTPEDALCQELGITRMYGVGYGGKVQSSSWMIRDAAKGILRSQRPWGEFSSWDTGHGWYLKTIRVAAGKRLSLQYHRRRSECWLLVQGDATATTVHKAGQRKKTKLKMGELFHIAKGEVHRLESKKGGVVIEVAYGAFDENDIVRIEDDFGRA